jgi:aspartate racemase
MIGIVGGVGPYAGLDLCKKIFDQTQSYLDQGHVSLALLSMPQEIEDRTAFLLGKSECNPAHVVSKLILTLERIGAQVIGIPCNTMHAPKIYNSILRDLEKTQSRVKLLHLINEVADFILEYYPEANNVGILSTIGTYQTNIYNGIFQSKGLNIVLPSLELQIDAIHKSVYDSQYGIKAQSSPVTDTAKKQVIKVIKYLRQKGAQAVVLACTELSLAITEEVVGDILIIDSNLVLARALIREEEPQKLKPYIRIKNKFTNIGESL